MNWFNNLFCKHDYVYESQQMINGGMGKILFYKCSKCGKVNIEII
jgi:uncharacterized OB-fold protein